jgi:hypothetical protein
MKISLKNLFVATSALLIASAALAKLPALSDDAKAKAAEAAAKTAWSGKVDGYQLCKAQDRVAAYYKKAKPPVATSSCVDPGPFVYTASPPAAVSTATPAASPAVATPAKKS